MDNKVNLKLFLNLPIIFFFLPAFVFWVPFLSAGYTYFFIFLYIALGLLFITNYKYCIYKLYLLYKKTPLKYFVYVLILIVFNSLLLGIFGKANIMSCLRSIIMQIFLFVIPIMVYFICIIGKYITLKNFMKFFILLFWIMLILGFVAYIGQYFQIEFVNNIFDFFANARLIKFEKLGRAGVTSNYVAFGLPRLDNLFEEPSFYARFLFLFLPMVYSFGLTKVKIYKNEIINLIIKKTLIPFTWINIVLTLSPMFLILSFLITLIYFAKEIFLLIKKYWIIITCVIFMVIMILFKVDLSETYLSRIVNVLSQVRSFEDFILIEPSLATRICTYINSFILFLKHPFTGIGLGSIQEAIVRQFYNSPIALTPEIINKIDFITKTNTRYSVNTNFIVDLISTNGIFIFSIFIYFYSRLLVKIRKIFVCMKNEDSFDYILSKTLYYLLISLIIKSCYDSCLVDMDMHFIFSLAILFIFYKKQKDKINA